MTSVSIPDDLDEFGLSSIFRVGELVEFRSSSSRAWIVSFNNDERTCTIKHVLGDGIEENISIDDLKVTSTLSNSTTNRSGTNRNTPHVLEPHLSTTMPPPPQPLTESGQLYQQFKDVLIQSFYSPQTPSTAHRPIHHLYNYMKENNTKPKGWLKEIIRKGCGNDEGEKKVKKMTAIESMAFLTIQCLFALALPTSGPFKGYRRCIQHAFGAHRETAKSRFENLINRNFDVGRKKRSDAGSSVFNSEKKRKSTFTGYNTFKKHRNGQYRETTERIPEATLREEYENLGEGRKEAFKIIAERDFERSKHLWNELSEFLLKAKGKVSFATMAVHLDHIVSESTIMKCLKEREGFKTRKDRILPYLSLDAKDRRLVWAHTWWLLFLSVAAVPIQRVIFVLIHMDEKWFYAVVTRSNCKILTSIGLEPADYYAQHKNHIGKEMYVVVTAFVLTNDNDIRKGGVAIPIACVRVGRMRKAQYNTYRRVYKEDGSHHYPKIPENQLRKEGEEYFKNVELTGSNEGTDKKPKMSLLKIYQEEIIPAIEEKVVQRFSQNGTRKVVCIKQEDSAGLHQDKKYVRTMRREFKKRDWILFNQPAQSPITNVHDACVFPMLSKAVSREQAVTFGSRLLKGEQLNQTVMKVWQDKKNLHAIARAFAAHHQIVNSIIKHKGDNNFLTEKGGLTFGIRRMYVRNEEGDGVVPVTLAPEDVQETAQDRLIAESGRRGLKYDTPNLKDLKKA